MTFVGIEAGVGNARLTLRGDQLSPRVLSAGPDRARIAFVATTALLLAGDHIDIEIDVGPGAGSTSSTPPAPSPTTRAGERPANGAAGGRSASEWRREAC